MLENMFIGNPPGTYDHLLDFSRAVTGCLFFVPTADFLDNVTPEPPQSAGLEQGDPQPADGPAAQPSPGDGSLGIGSLRKEAGQ
jgi:putative iron-dependent peroxidase